VSLRRSSDMVMRPGVLRLIALLAAVLLSACVTRPPRQTETYYFDCDVPEGRFAEWNRTVKGSEVHVSGIIELIEPRRDPTWRPVANVFVTGKDSSFYAGLRLTVDWDSQDSVHVSLIGTTGAVGGDALISLPWRGETIPFSLVLTHSGELTVRAGDGSRAVHVSQFEPQNVRLSCSTGQFKYRDVSVDVLK
jgi:hypothetical protein